MLHSLCSERNINHDASMFEADNYGHNSHNNSEIRQNTLSTNASLRIDALVVKLSVAAAMHAAVTGLHQFHAHACAWLIMA
jgi:hypothetical protein